MIYLSFDIEEFDMPKEYGFDIPFEATDVHLSRGSYCYLGLTQKA